MAISATIANSRFGTSHDTAYMKIIKTTTDYLTNKSCSHVGVYDSVDAYLQGAQPMYIEKLDYDEEYVQDTWGNTESATPPRQTAYRASRNQIKKISDYSNIVNIYEHDFEGGESLTEQEVEQLKDLRKELSNVEEHIEAGQLQLIAEQEKLSNIVKKQESVASNVETLKSDLTTKKVEAEAAEEDLREKTDKMKGLKETAEKTGAESDIQAVKDHEIILAASEQDFQEKDIEIKVATKQLDEITRELDKLTASKQTVEEEIADIEKEVDSAKEQKDEVEQNYGNLIAKDVTAKFIETSNKNKQSS